MKYINTYHKNRITKLLNEFNFIQKIHIRIFKNLLLGKYQNYSYIIIRKVRLKKIHMKKMFLLFENLNDVCK